MDLELSGVDSQHPPKDTPQTSALQIVAFGFKYGPPDNLDMLFDVRFLKNPNYVPELQPLTGADPAVGAYIEQDPAAMPFLHKLFDLLDFVTPLLRRECITIGIGCTGGRHRSVFVAQRLREHFQTAQREVELILRDIS